MIVFYLGLFVIAIESELAPVRVNDQVAVCIERVARRAYAVRGVVDGWLFNRCKSLCRCSEPFVVGRSVSETVISERLFPRLSAVTRLLCFGKPIERVVLIRLHERVSQAVERDSLLADVAAVLCSIYGSQPALSLCVVTRSF